MKILIEGKPQIAECKCGCKFIYNGADIIYFDDIKTMCVRCPNCGVLIEVRR